MSAKDELLEFLRSAPVVSDEWEDTVNNLFDQITKWLETARKEDLIKTNRTFQTCPEMEIVTPNRTTILMRSNKYTKKIKLSCKGKEATLSYTENGEWDVLLSLGELCEPLTEEVFYSMLIEVLS
jgi:hypothetical protein